MKNLSISYKTNDFIGGCPFQVTLLRFSLMLLALFFATNRLFGQSITNSEYTFKLYKVTNDDRFSSEGISCSDRWQGIKEEGGISAIIFENSTGNIVNNSITGDGRWFYGIMNFSSGSTPPTTFTYMCNNTISNGGGEFTSGIFSDRYAGYVKLCNISNWGYYGYLSGLNDHPSIVFSSITDCPYSGIRTSSGSSIVDLSGVHGASSSGDDIAAFNTISNNYDNIAGNQISLTASSHIEYGDRLATWAWSNFGENNTLASTSSPLLIFAGGTGSTLGSIEQNFWGSGVDPGLGGGISPGLWDAGGLTVYSTGITYAATTANTRTSEIIREFEVTCSGGFERIKNKNQALAIQSPPTDTCSRWHNWSGVKPQTQDEFKKQRDTLTRYIESCAKNDDSYEIFPALTSSIERYNEDDTTRFENYRNWLLSVVFLNTTTPYYYCACVTAMMSTYQYSKYKSDNTVIAIARFLLENPNCNDEGMQMFYKQLLKSRHEDWLSSGDTTIPEDTTIPSLDSIGLGALLHHSGVSPSTVPSQIYLASFTSSPNPFMDETTLQFHLNRMAYITIEVFDVLGQRVWGDGKGSSLESGDHTIRLNGTGLPKGTLYARISTGFGEIKTVKLVRE